MTPGAAGIIAKVGEDFDRRAPQRLPIKGDAVGDVIDVEKQERDVGHGFLPV